MKERLEEDDRSAKRIKKEGCGLPVREIDWRAGEGRLSIS